MEVVLALCLAAVTLFLFSWWKRWGRGLRLPPGPKALPVIGHLHLLAKAPSTHILLTNLCRKHGPLMSLRFGSTPVVVASSKEAAREIYKTHDSVFASRPPTAIGRLLFDNYQDMGLAPYGERWRQLRKLCMLELFSARRIGLFKEVRMEEVGSLLNSLLQNQDQVADLRPKLTALAFNHLCRVLMGKPYYSETVEDKQEATQFMHMIDELFDLVSVPPVGDHLPWLRWMDIGRTEARLKTVKKSAQALIGRIIVEHENRRKNGQVTGVEDFIDVLVKLRDDGEDVLQGRTIEFLLLNLFTAGSDTNSVTLEWALAELIKHPSSMARLQEEIAEVVGLERLVDESDVPNLPFLHAVLKESFRLHGLPLLLPHYSMDKGKVMGYDVAKGTTIFINAYAIGRDPSLWEEPLEFRPERFVGSKIDFAGQDFEFLPFGSGRRICPGMTMAASLLYLSLANLVHAFDWKMPPGEEVDNVNEAGGTMPLMAKKLQAIPTPRLAPQVIVSLKAP